MKRILILSVGGSAEPIINAIKKDKSDYVYFLCSAGPKGSEITIDGFGDPCGDKRRTKCPACDHEFYLGNPKGKAIVFQAGLTSSQYDVLTVEDPDDLDECYEKLLKLADMIETQHGKNCRIIANYTGGTKTMSVTMALVGLLTEKWDLSINIGPRPDLIKVKSGDVPVRIDKWRVFCQTQIESVRKSIRNFDYAFAHYLITEMLQHSLDKTFRIKLLAAAQLCQAFDLWDKFEHDKALALLESYGAYFSQHIITLKQILKKQRKVCGYEMVGDLLNNATRKAHRRYYDDAVGRIYRATELFAQIRLKKQYRYDTSNILLTDLPENLQKQYISRVKEKNKLILGLQEDYELLSKLKDHVGQKYFQQKKEIKDALSYRNNSISAHGLKPLDEDDYRYVKNTLQGFIESVSKDINIDFKISQLPQEGII